jgi:hypothetical protein
VGQLLGFPEYPGGPQYVSNSWLPKPPFPRSKAHTVVSGEAGVVALNSWHHCGTHVTAPCGSLETPLQPPWATWDRPAPTSHKTTIARRHLDRQTKLPSIRIRIGVHFLRRMRACAYFGFPGQKTGFSHGSTPSGRESRTRSAGSGGPWLLGCTRRPRDHPRPPSAMLTPKNAFRTCRGTIISSKTRAARSLSTRPTSIFPKRPGERWASSPSILTTMD